MFQRIVDLCRSLVGKQTRSAAAANPAEEDRRVWVRFPSVVETTLLPVANGVDTRLSARVHNVSRGGIKLVVPHSFVPGDLVSIDLPGGTPESSDTVLACVVHVKGAGEHEWTVGCVFSEELNDEELEAFGARRVKAPATDNRGYVRFPCEVRATFERVDDPENRRMAVEVADISATGIGLVLDHTLSPGALLSLHLQNASGEATRTILACVVHVATRPGNRCHIGCNFIRELAEDDLKALL